MSTKRDLESLFISELVYEVNPKTRKLPIGTDLPPRSRNILETYRVVDTYVDRETGFKGIALEEKNGSGRRIIAGPYNLLATDLRKITFHCRM